MTAAGVSLRPGERPRRLRGNFRTRLAWFGTERARGLLHRRRGGLDRAETLRETNPPSRDGDGLVGRLPESSLKEGEGGSLCFGVEDAAAAAPSSALALAALAAMRELGLSDAGWSAHASGISALRDSRISANCGRVSGSLCQHCCSSCIASVGSHVGQFRACVKTQPARQSAPGRELLPRVLERHELP